METSKAGLNLMFSPEWVRNCWGSCPRCGRWGTRWGSWRVCRCCWACCTASTRSCCGASPGSWSSCARTLTPGRRSGAGAACSSFSGCSTGLSDWAIKANSIIYIRSYEFNCTASLFTDPQKPFTFVFSAFLILKGHSRDFTITYSWEIHKRQIWKRKRKPWPI